MTKAQIESQIYILIAYLESKLEARDWHAISDAANDLRVLEAKLEVICLINNDSQ